MLAQGFDPTAWLGQFGQYGLLGILFALALWTLYKRDADLSQERKGRLDDARAFADMVRADTEAKTAANLQRDAQNKLLETLTRNQEAFADELRETVKK